MKYLAALGFALFAATQIATAWASFGWHTIPLYVGISALTYGAIFVAGRFDDWRVSRTVREIQRNHRRSP